MRVAAIASSSKGNAYVVEHGGHVLLIDCGVPYKDVSDVPAEAVLVTHSHADHALGLKTLFARRGVPVYANAMTAETIVHDFKVPEEAFVCFENGQCFDVGPFAVSPFSIPHDTSDPVGFLVQAEGETYFHGTDIGSPLDSVGLKLAEANIATLESNHDPVLLRTSGRHPSLICRIAGPRGHLSNDDACELVRRFASPKLRHLALAHLSHDCNTPRLALEAMRATLREMQREDVEVEVFA